MALTTGTRLGQYEIVALLGAGGMGEVYRARDPKLNREVAIKVLPATVADDAHRLARFSREAQVLASLNHTNIGQIYGLEDSSGVPALVMELIEGPTLADRISQGAIAVDEALPIAKQIAEAVEAAHDQGIIHRDLKPANIKVRADGAVKVLDFGLAKALDPVGSASVDAANSPTLSMMATAAGVILGTAGYMAPEQARGKAVDKRADIWAFGCVLFEMLSGTRAFGGDEVTDTIVAVVSREPDWQALPAAAAGLRPLLARCLRKDRKQRLQSIGDARVQIEELIAGTSEGAAAPSAAEPAMQRSVVRAAIAALAGGAAITALVAWALTTPAPPAPLLPPLRFAIVPPEAQSLSLSSDRDIAISPDGRYIVYRGGSPLNFAGGGQLVVRAVGDLEARPLPGIISARQPFFSPDSRWIGFFDGLTLKKVSIEGGAAISICQTQGQSRGASWGDDNRIVFSTTDTSIGLLQVAAGGGEPAVLTTPDPAKGETNHWYPSVLPNGRGVLFTLTARNAAATARVAVLDLRTGQHKTLMRGSQAEYVRDGHLVYVAEGTLHAVKFDLENLEPLGDPVPVVESVRTVGGGAANYSVSQAGTLVYVPADAEAQRSLVWVDRKGKETPIALPPRLYDEVRVSPDGSQVAVTIRDQENDIYILDLARETLKRLTFDPSFDANPVWTPKGDRIIFGSQRAKAANVSNLFTQAADGTGTVEQLTTSLYWQTPSFVTPDGTGIIGFQNPPKTAGDVVRFPFINPAHQPASGSASETGSSPVEPIIQTSFSESNPELSPDGHYIAYQSNESKQNEIYVRPFPRVNDGRWQVSSKGGKQPAWGRSGRELFYLDLTNRLTAVPVGTSGTTFTVGNPARVLDAAYADTAGASARSYDVSADGQRFLVIKENVAEDAPRRGMVIVVNWFSELRDKLTSATGPK